jgi:hypothetical protein
MDPLILVDVDGVLNPDFRCHPPYCKCHPGWLKRSTYPGGFKFNVTVNPLHGTWLRQLAADTGGQLAWGSTWEDHANEWIAPLIGLPAAIPAGVTHGKPFKADTLIPWCDGRPWVWFDDDDTELYQATTLATGPCLTVWVEPTIGLTEAHIATARQWLLDRKD